MFHREIVRDNSTIVRGVRFRSRVAAEVYKLALINILRDQRPGMARCLRLRCKTESDAVGERRDRQGKTCKLAGHGRTPPHRIRPRGHPRAQNAANSHSLLRGQISGADSRSSPGTRQWNFGSSSEGSLDARFPYLPSFRCLPRPPLALRTAGGAAGRAQWCRQARPPKPRSGPDCWCEKGCSRQRSATAPCTWCF